MNTEADEPHPEMSDAVLSDDEVASLIRDLRACTVIDEIIVKSGPGHVNDAPQTSLDDAAQLLMERAVRGVQIRYRYDNARWMDTLMPIAEGIRLVRVRHELEAGSDA